MEFNADLNLLPEMMAFVRGSLGKKISDQDLMRIELSAEEALVNVISYGKSEKVKIDITQDAREFTIKISDQGQAFDPTTAPIDPRVDRPLTERKVGGLGIYLIRKLADEVSYKREENHNVLTVKFKAL